MKRIRAFFLRLDSLFQKSRCERELNEELTSHLELHIDDNLRAGMAPGEARRQAIFKLGGVEPTKDNYRDRRGLPFLDRLFQDLRYAARTLTNNRGFAAITIATLALGIGTSTAMFTVVQAVLLRPLPYTQPEGLVEIAEANPLRRSTHNDVSLPDFFDWQQMSTAFSGMALYAGINDSGQGNYDLFLTGEGEPVRLKGLGVTSNLFDVLGIAPMIGRNFTSDEFYDGADRAAILSYGFWQTQLRADTLIGRSIYRRGATSVHNWDRRALGQHHHVIRALNGGPVGTGCSSRRECGMKPAAAAENVGPAAEHWTVQPLLKVDLGFFLVVKKEVPVERLQGVWTP